MTTPAKILVVDDSEIVLEAVSTALAPAGYTVLTRQLSVGALATVLRERPDLVLLDVNMPLMSGQDLVATIRRHDVVKSSLVLLHAHRPAPELDALAKECGADGYIEKTPDARRLRHEVGAWLQRGRSRPPAAVRDYVLLACGDATRRQLEQAITLSVPVRFTDSGTEALRHVYSTLPPRLLALGSSLVDMRWEVVLAEARRRDPSWQRRLILLDETGDDPRNTDLWTWSVHESPDQLLARLQQLDATRR